MIIFGNSNKEINIHLSNDKLEQVKVYKYSEAKIKKGGGTTEVDKRTLTNTSRMYYSLSKAFIAKKEVTKKTKMILYKINFRPILTYSSKSSILAQALSKMNAIDMKYLWKVKRITKRDSIRNSTVGERK